MYPYDFEPKQQSLRKEIFVAMSFAKEYDKIYKKLIKPAVGKANEKLKCSGDEELKPYRTKDDPRTVSGWINILEHLFTAQIVLGVLTSDNANVFYELGIAHATQPITRQILIANEGYEPKFDLKDLIFFKYSENYEESIEPLALKIQDTIEYYKIEREKGIHQARMEVGLLAFIVMLTYANVSHFSLKISEEFILEHDKQYGKGLYDKHVQGVESLSQLGLLGLNTKKEVVEQNRIEFAFYWTGLGNEVLALMKLITNDERIKRWKSLPLYFR